MLTVGVVPRRGARAALGPQTQRRPEGVQCAEGFHFFSPLCSPLHLKMAAVGLLAPAEPPDLNPLLHKAAGQGGLGSG